MVVVEGGNDLHHVKRRIVREENVRGGEYVRIPFWHGQERYELLGWLNEDVI